MKFDDRKDKNLHPNRDYYIKLENILDFFIQHKRSPEIYNQQQDVTFWFKKYQLDYKIDFTFQK